jgi:aminoglycoside phosphotransferase (APT) family kinase protein
VNNQDYIQLARAIGIACYGQEAKIELLRAVNHAVFRLRLPDGDRVLKLAATPDARALRKEHLLIGLIAPHGIPVPVIEHADLDGHTAQWPFLLMRSAGEQTLADLLVDAEAGIDPVFRQMGAVLAGIHNLSLPAGGDIEYDRISSRDPEQRLQRVRAVADWAETQGLASAADVALFRTLPMPSIEGHSLCHGDFHAVQCIVRERRIAAVADWETAWSGNPGIDLAVTHAYLECYCPRELAAAFWQGYLACRPLPENYARAYMPVRMAQALALMKVWHTSGMQQPLEHAVELFRVYCEESVT